jgi:hypothetical protein
MCGAGAIALQMIGLGGGDNHIEVNGVCNSNNTKACVLPAAALGSLEHVCVHHTRPTMTRLPRYSWR